MIIGKKKKKELFQLDYISSEIVLSQKLKSRSFIVFIAQPSIRGVQPSPASDPLLGGLPACLASIGEAPGPFRRMLYGAGAARTLLQAVYYGWQAFNTTCVLGAHIQ